MRALWVGALVAATLACSRGADDQQTEVTSVDQIVAGAPDDSMKQRWREAEKKGQLPPLDTLPPAGPPITQRTPARVQDSPRTPARPVIQDAVVATVQPFSTTALAQYAGPITITNATPTSIAGTLPGRADPFELHFKLPDRAQLQAPALKTEHRLRVRDEVQNQSLRRELFLSTASRAPLLVYVSDGGMRPYSRTFEEIPLTVTQLAPGADGVSRVTLALGGAAATLRPGERARLAAAGAALGVFLESSFWTPADQVEAAEGDAYHVVFMLYRPAAG